MTLLYWRGLTPLSLVIPAGTSGHDIEQCAEVEVADLEPVLHESTPAADLAASGRFETQAPKRERVHFGMRHEDGPSKLGHQGRLVLPPPCRNPGFPAVCVLENDQRAE